MSDQTQIGGERKRQSPPPSLLKDRRFRNLWGTVELSFLGMFLHVVAASWLMTTLTPSAVLVALIQSAYSLPIVAFSLIAGTLADIFDRRKTMLLSLLFSLSVSMLLADLSAWDMLTPTSILALIFSVGVGVAIFTPSWQASLGDLVPRERLMEAVSLHNIGANAMRTIGPSLGGLLVAAVSVSATFFCGALTYVPALACMLVYGPRGSKLDGERESLKGALELGIRFLLVSPPLQQLLLRVFCFSFAAVSVMALLPLVVRDQFERGASSYGILFGGFGLGAILAGLALSHLRRRMTVETIVRWSILLNVLAIGLLASNRVFWAGLPAAILAGCCWLVVHSLQNSVMQLATPRWIAGRMVAMFLSSAFLGVAAGSWLWGVLAELTNTQVTLAVSATTMLATYGLVCRIRMPETDGLALEPLEGAGEPAENAPGPDSGPLHILIEHRIDIVNIPSFVQAMEKRRRHLTQLGAQHWTLLQDARDTTRWAETYRTANWAEYRRIMSRRTAETRILRAEIAGLQQDGSAPAVRLLAQRLANRRPVDAMLRA